MAAYALSNHYAGASLLGSFDFFTGVDRNNGFVDYLNQDAAMAHGLASIQDGNRVRLGVDSTTVLRTNDTGRPSVMLTSKESFTHGLFIADFDHMPASSCGSWPSFWAFNNNDETVWPKGGEIGIVEGANNAARNLFSAHTEDGCTLPDSGFLGAQGPEQCNSSGGLLGCNYAAPSRDPTSFGDAFNAADGGVYALEWDEAYLKMWHFPRSSIPIDIQVGQPQPSEWGLPHALFGGPGCDTDTYFYNMSLVLNINFCGNYAGGLWAQTDSCNQLASSCEAYVASHPEAYSEEFWDIRYIDVYKKTTPLADSGSRSTPRPLSPSPSLSPEPALPADYVVTKTIVLSQAPAPTTGPLGLKKIGGYVLLGCFEFNNDGYERFDQALSSTAMTNKLCISTCRKMDRPYSGVNHDTCYCAARLGDVSAQSLTSCTMPCPGDGSQFCGGPGRSRNTYGSNSTSPAGLLTIYGDLAEEPLPPNAPGKGSDGRDSGGGVVVTRVAYTAICSTNSAELCEYGYYATVTAKKNACAATTTITTGTGTKLSSNVSCMGGGGGGGGSLNQTTSYGNSLVYPAVPMATITQTCDACGPKNQSTVTLTVPGAVAATASGIVEEEEDITITLVRTVLPLTIDASSSSYSSSSSLTVLAPPPSGYTSQTATAAAAAVGTQTPVAVAVAAGNAAPGPGLGWLSAGSRGVLLATAWLGGVLGLVVLF